jgi:hypothetical protein
MSLTVPNLNSNQTKATPVLNTLKATTGAYFRAAITG